MIIGMTHLHSLLRWLIILAGIWAVVKMAGGLSGSKAFTAKDKKPGLFFLIFCDLQILVGLVLYFFGPRGLSIWKNVPVPEIMHNTPLRFYAMEHAVSMIIAIVLVHIGFAATKKLDNPAVKIYKKAFYCFLIALIIILAATPWPFRQGLGMPLFPGMS